MTRYACKSYFDNDAQEKRYAVERQDGDVYRILQRQFITEDGAEVWLGSTCCCSCSCLLFFSSFDLFLSDSCNVSLFFFLLPPPPLSLLSLLARYKSIKQNKHEKQSARDAMRREIARKHDPRRCPTRAAGFHQYPPTSLVLPPPTPPLYFTSVDLLKSCWKSSVQFVVNMFNESISAIPACMGLRGSAGWHHYHLSSATCLCCNTPNPLSLDICMSWLCCAPCLIHNLHQIISKSKDEQRLARNELCGGYLNPGLCCVCCCACNRRRIALHYDLNESCPQTWCYSCFCPCCSCCQEMIEVSIREQTPLGKPCCCCTKCVWAGRAKGKRYTHRNTIGSRVGGSRKIERNAKHATVVSSFVAPPPLVIVTRDDIVRSNKSSNMSSWDRREEEVHPAHMKFKKTHYLNNSFRAVGTADHSIHFNPRLDIGQKMQRQIPIKPGWDLR